MNARVRFCLVLTCAVFAAAAMCQGQTAGSEPFDPLAGLHVRSQPAKTEVKVPKTRRTHPGSPSSADHAALAGSKPGVEYKRIWSSGYKIMKQSQVTKPMTDWAVAILHAPKDFPMYSTTTKTFGTHTVLALVEWHPPDFQNHSVHRGVTLFMQKEP